MTTSDACRVGRMRRAPRRIASLGSYGLGFISQTNSPGLKEFYESQRRAYGHEPRPAQFAVPANPTTVFASDDVKEARADVAWPYLERAATAAHE